MPVNMLRLALLLAAVAASLPVHAYAPDGASPRSFLGRISPSTPPEEVVAMQLDALQAEDLPSVFFFGSPMNHAVSGPPQQFESMIRSPPYDKLIHHNRWEIVMTVSNAKDESRWRGLVQVWPKGKPHASPKEYWWALSRVPDTGMSDVHPQEVGCFMVDAVVPNKSLGEVDVC